MKVKTLFAWVIWVAVLACSVHPASAQAPQPAIRGILDNGLAYVVIPSGEMPGKVRVGLYVFGGKAYEDADNVESAHLVEHILAGFYQDDNGEIRPLAEHPSTSIAVGMDGAITDFYDTRYFSTFKTAEVDEGLKLFRGVAHGFKFNLSDQNFDGMRRSIVAEGFTSERSEGHRNLERLSLYWKSPGAVGVSTAQAMEKVTIETLRRFYDLWYQPQNEFIYIVGDIVPEEARELIKRRFGDIPRGKGPSVGLLKSRDFNYLHYKSGTDQESRVFIQIGVGASKKFPAADAMVSLISDGVRQCLDRKMGSREAQDQHSYYIFRAVDQHSFRNNSRGVELAFSSKPENMVTALHFAAQSVSSCKAELLQADIGRKWQKAVAGAAENPARVGKDLVKEYIVTSELFDRPAFQNSVAQYADPGSPESSPVGRDQILNWMLSVGNMKIAAFDPSANLSILASERSVRRILSLRAERKISGAKEAHGSDGTDVAYQVGEQLSALVVPRLTSDGRWFSAKRAASLGPLVLKIASNRGYLDLDPELAAHAVSVRSFLLSNRMSPRVEGDWFDSARIAIEPESSSLSINISSGAAFDRGPGLTGLSISKKDVADFVIDQTDRRYEFLFRPVQDILSSSTLYIARNGKKMGCSDQVLENSSFSQFDDVLYGLFGPSADLKLELLSGDKITMIRQSLASAEDASPPTSANLSGDIDVRCEGASTVSAATQLLFLPQAEVGAFSDEQRQLASQIISTRFYHRLREQISGVYAPNTALVTLSGLQIASDFVSLPEDVEKLKNGAKEEVEKIARDGPSAREVELACARLQIDQCDTRRLQAELSAIFRTFLGAKMASIGYYPKASLR